MLYECIHAELQEMHPSLYALLVSKKTAPRKSDTSPRDCFPRLARVPREQLGHCEFIDTHTLPEPWQDMQRLQVCCNRVLCVSYIYMYVYICLYIVNMLGFYGRRAASSWATMSGDMVVHRW